MATKRSCGWCHHLGTLNPNGATSCKKCGHRVDVPRLDCDCKRCQGEADDQPSPGPWSWHRSDDDSISEITDASGDLVVSMVDDRGEPFSAPERFAANGHLIEAAPRLYAALEAIIDAANGNPEPIHFAVREAIDKARIALAAARPE